MNERLLLGQNCHDEALVFEQVPDALNLNKRIPQIEREQIADEDRIDTAIRRATHDIAWLQQRQLGLEELQDAITAIRDKTVLVVRDVRKNMQRRSIDAERMQKCFGDDFLHLRARFSRNDYEDKKLRRSFLHLLERTPTSSLVEHFRDAVEVGNFACAELIRFEFHCRDDQDEFKTDFESIVQKFSRDDPVEMRKRLANVCKAIERVDARVMGLLQAVRVVRSPEQRPQRSSLAACWSTSLR
jgi:hypothetical protein